MCWQQSLSNTVYIPFPLCGSIYGSLCDLLKTNKDSGKGWVMDLFIHRILALSEGGFLMFFLFSNLIKTNNKKSVRPNEWQLADLHYSTGGPPEFLMLGDGQVITSCVWLFSTRLSPMFIVNYLPLKAVIASLMFPHHKFDLHCFFIYLHVLLYSLKCFILKEDNRRMKIEQNPNSCLTKRYA